MVGGGGGGGQIAGEGDSRLGVSDLTSGKKNHATGWEKRGCGGARKARGAGGVGCHSRKRQ